MLLPRHLEFICCIPAHPSKNKSPETKWFQGSLILALPRGFEPPTSSLGNCCSILLSYGSNTNMITNNACKNKAGIKGNGTGRPSTIGPVLLVLGAPEWNRTTYT